jgi:phosphate acetyltransferase
VFTTVLVAPVGRRVGLTTACLGLVRALDRHGLRVAFVKPIANRGLNHSAALMQLGAHMTPTLSVPRQQAEELLSAGDDQTLMEHVVEVANRAAKDADVLIAEGLDPEGGMVYSSRVNGLMLRALDAELLLVASGGNQPPEDVAGAVAIAARGYGALVEGRAELRPEPICRVQPRQPVESESIGPVSGECSACPGACAIDELAAAHRAALGAEGIRTVGIVPCNPDVAAPRVHDVAMALGAEKLAGGDARLRRVKDVAVCAMSVPNALKAMKPGTLLLTPGDRTDIPLAPMKVQTGRPRWHRLDRRSPARSACLICAASAFSRLATSVVQEGTFRTATRVSSMNTEIQEDDAERVERTMNFVADRIDSAWLKGFEHATRVPRLSPPAFRHRLVEAARADQQRIVLPEGNEPRTVAAAAIVARRGIAKCVLLGSPEDPRGGGRQKEDHPALRRRAGTCWPSCAKDES